MMIYKRNQISINNFSYFIAIVFPHTLFPCSYTKGGAVSPNSCTYLRGQYSPTDIGTIFFAFVKHFTHRNSSSAWERLKCTWDCRGDHCLLFFVSAPPAPSDAYSLRSVLLFCPARAAADCSPLLTDCLCPWTHCKEKQLALHKIPKQIDTGTFF